MVHRCEKCGKMFNRRDNLDYHESHDACKVSNYVCKYCGKRFTTATSMYRHIRTTCSVKKSVDEEKEHILDSLVKTQEETKKQIDRLKEENKKYKEENKKYKEKTEKLEQDMAVLKSQGGCTVINKNNSGPVVNSAQNVLINNITLVGYGKEDLSKLPKSDILKVLQNGYQSTIKLTEAVHFNPKYPENHNIYISNMKDKYAMMFDGKKWTLTTKEVLVNQIYEDKKNYIEENLEEFIDSLTSTKRQALKR